MHQSEPVDAPIELVGGPLCGVPGVRVDTAKNEATFTRPDQHGKKRLIYVYHHSSGEKRVFWLDDIVAIPDEE